MPNVAFGSKPIRREEAGLGQAKRRGRPASCREGGRSKRPNVAGRPAIRKKRQAWDRPREEAGLPAAEGGLGAVQNA